MSSIEGQAAKPGIIIDVVRRKEIFSGQNSTDPEAGELEKQLKDIVSRILKDGGQGWEIFISFHDNAHDVYVSARRLAIRFRADESFNDSVQLVPDGPLRFIADALLQFLLSKVDMQKPKDMSDDEFENLLHKRRQAQLDRFAGSPICFDIGGSCRVIRLE